MLDINKNLFLLFKQNKVLYCNWKGTSKIGQALNGDGDIDILVSPQSQVIAEALLANAGFVKVRTQWECRFNGINDWIGNDNNTGTIVHVHLHYRMIAGHPSTMEYTLPWAVDVLNSRLLLNNGVYTINPEWEMLVFLTRMGLEYPNKKISNLTHTFNKSGYSEINDIKNKINLERFERIVNNTLKDCSSVLLGFVNKNDYVIQDFNLLQNSIVKCFRGHLFNSYYKTLSTIKHHIVQRIFPSLGYPQKKTLPHGIVIAFLGQDGSGKSTVTNDVEKWLSKKIEVKRFYLGSGREYYNPWQRRVLDKLEQKNHSWTKPIRSWLYFSELLGSSNYVLKSIKEANAFAMAGGVALLDRFPQIQYEGINDGPKIRVLLFDKVPIGFKWIANIYANKEEKNLKKAVSIAPSLVFKLMLSPEVSKERKPFENFDMIKRKHNIIKSLQFTSSQVEIIDAEQPYESELVIIKRIIWKKIKE